MKEHHLREQAFDGTIELVVKGAWTSGTTRALRGGQYDRLVLKYARGFQDRTLDALVGLPVRRLMLLARTVTDMDGHYALDVTLEELSITSGASEVRLDRLPRLTSISADWPTIRRTVSAASQLEVLSATDFPDVDLGRLSGLTRLRTCVLTDCHQLGTLAGLEVLDTCENFILHGAARLGDVSRLCEVRNPLRALTIFAAGLLRDYGPVFDLEHLESLELSDCGPILSSRRID